jgi:predicted phosphodiesterase
VSDAGCLTPGNAGDHLTLSQNPRGDMKLLVVQLSDIHIRDRSDWILTRASRIAEAVRNLDHEIGLCLLVFTGDIAFSGSADQYRVAESWITSLRQQLRNAVGDRVPVKVVAIPGNHDCDLTNPSPARTALIEAMARDPRIADDPNTQATCLQPLDSFFEFFARVASEDISQDGRVYYEYRFEIGDDSILVRCCNTAWASQLPEDPAKLVYPVELVHGEPNPDDSLVLSVLHHPYNWLEPANGRALRRQLQNVSDVILTGHEHEFALREQRDERGATAVYIEGVALQGPKDVEQTSEFHVLLVDVAAEKYRLIPFTWRKSRYEAERTPFSEWTDLTVNPLRAGNLFPVSEGMRQQLADPGMVLTHPVRGSLRLGDIFVYPDLIEVQYEPRGTRPRIVKGENLLQLIKDSRRLLITGPDDCGKTALAKRIFLDALDAGLVPLLLDGQTVRLRGEARDLKELGSAFEDQYDAKAQDYLDTSRERRLVIVDDFSSLQLKNRTSGEILDYLTHFADYVVLLAHDLAQEVREIAGLSPIASGRAPFIQYQILPVSHVRREEMVGRYLSLAGKGDRRELEDLRTDMRRILDAALGKYYAPPVPLSVISILQARAFNDQINLSQSTYGYYFELLIKRVLIANTSHQELDVRFAYLTELAYAVYVAGISSWDESWMMDFHQRFSREGKLSLRFSDVIKTLLAAGILSLRDDRYRFRYAYIYYYFAGRALAERLSTTEGREQLHRLASHLENEENANLLLFLTHHSKDVAIIDAMLARADGIFADASREELRVNAVDVADLQPALREVVFQDKTIEEAREEYLSRVDEAEQREVTSLETTDAGKPATLTAEAQEAVELLDRIFVAFRTMQILGQILKNFPGTLKGDQKTRITKAVFGVALRTLTVLLDTIRNQPFEYVAQIVEALRREHPEMTTRSLVLTALDTVYLHIYLASFGMTQRAATSVGASMLEPVFTEIADADDAPSVQLISMALRLERAGTFPEERVKRLSEALGDNPLAHRVLRGLVVTRFHLFDTDAQIKRSICKLLGIQYRPALPVSRRRLIAPPAR